MSRWFTDVARCWLLLLLLLLMVSLLPGCRWGGGGGDDDEREDGVSVSTVSKSKISSAKGRFDGPLENGDGFGSAIAAIGDLGGGRSIIGNQPEPDGVDDLAVGSPGDDTGAEDSGAVWILFMQLDGDVDDQQRIASEKGGFDGNLDAGDRFGSAITVLDDLDGDGVNDLVAGAPGDDDGGPGRGAVWVLFMERNGKVRDHQKISDDRGDLGATLEDGDAFGAAVSSIGVDLGDFNTDNIADLLLGIPGSDDGGTDRGAVWILHLATNGKVTTKEKISDKHGDFNGTLNDGDGFGSAVVAIGDLNDDGVVDLAVGAPGDDDSRNDEAGDGRGAVWILFMDRDGTVDRAKKISDDKGGFFGKLANGDRFGSALAAMGDLDGDGYEDVAVGAPGNDVSRAEGSVWVLFLDANGSVRSEQEISFKKGGFGDALDEGDAFGSAIASIGDFDANEGSDLAVGAPGDDDDGLDRGAVWLLFLNQPE